MIVKSLSTFQKWSCYISIPIPEHIMPGILRLASLEGEKARSARESAAAGSARNSNMTDRSKRTKNINEQPKRVEPSVEESRRRRERQPVTSSLRRTMDAHRHSSRSSPARPAQRHHHDARGTNLRGAKRNIRAASYQKTTAPAMPSRDRSLAALAALHSSYKSASSLVMDSNNNPLTAAITDKMSSGAVRVPADDTAIWSLQDKLLALAGGESTNNNEERRIRSNSLDSGRDESLKGVSARKPRAIALATSSPSRRELQKQILEDMRAKHRSARMRKIEPIGSRRAIVKQGSSKGLRYRASSSCSSNDSSKPSRGRTYSPRQDKKNMTHNVKREKKPVTKPTKSVESRVYFAPNDIDGAYQRLGWDTGATFQPRTEDRRYPPITTSVLKGPDRCSSVSDSLASGDTHSLTLADSSVDNCSVVAVESGAVSNQRKASLPQLPGSLLVPFPPRRSDDGSDSPTCPVFESTESAKLLPRSSIRAKMAAERANIPERISEENSDDCQEDSAQSSPTTNISFGSSTRQYASDRTLPCSNLHKSGKLPSNSSSGKDDSLGCSIPTRSSSDFDYVSPSKYLSMPSQDDLYEVSSGDEDDPMLGGGDSNDILAISLSLADVASDSFRFKANSIKKSPSAVSEKSKTSSLSTKSIDIHLPRNTNKSNATSIKIQKPNTPNNSDHRAFVVQGRGITPGAAPTQDSSDALFIIEDPESLLPPQSQGGANSSDRAIFNRYWEKASPKHHASNSGKDLLQISRRLSLGEDTESSESSAPPPPVWAKMEARHGNTGKTSSSIQVGIIEQDGTPLPDVPRRNIQRASMA